MTVILDYGMGNLGSVARALRHLGEECRVQAGLDGADRLIIPGVGAFGAAMEKVDPLRRGILEFVRSGRPLLGICLGQQLLFEESEELGQHRGLGLLKGKVRYLPSDNGLKVPHIGWNAMRWSPGHVMANHMNPGDQVYFVHSLYTECADPGDVAATTEYGIDFPSAVARNNVWGMQFHPEKSGQIGLRILKNFLLC